MNDIILILVLNLINEPDNVKKGCYRFRGPLMPCHYFYFVWFSSYEIRF